MSREVKSFLTNGPGITGHREHRSKRGRRRTFWSTRIVRTKKERILRKFVRKEQREEYAV